MERCKNCDKFYGERITEIKVGDQVSFTIERSTGRRMSMHSRVGKVAEVLKNGYAVLYRKQLYMVREVSPASDPSPLMLAITGECTCESR